MSSFRKTAVGLLLILLIGAQWPLLQSFAWLNMFVSFSAEVGIKQALVKTFDGKHLCKMCKFVRAGQEAEKKGPVKDSAKKKLDPMLADHTEVSLDPVSRPAPLLSHFKASPRVHTPPGEPPDVV